VDNSSVDSIKEAGCAPELVYMKKSQYICNNKPGENMELCQTSRVYTKEFKEETIGLILDRGMSVSQISKNLSIGTEKIYRWIRKYKADPIKSFLGKGHFKPEDEDYDCLNKSNKRTIDKNLTQIYNLAKSYWEAK